LRIVEHAAVECELVQGGHDLVFEIGAQHGSSFRLLTGAWNSHPPAQVGGESAAVEIGLRASNRSLTARYGLVICFRCVSCTAGRLIPPAERGRLRAARLCHMPSLSAVCPSLNPLQAPTTVAANTKLVPRFRIS